MDLPPQLRQQLDALLAPPLLARPVTADDRYHDLRQEVDKLGSVTGASVDWRIVATLGAGLTCELSKDLNILAYTVFARFKLRDLAGALVGVVALGALLQTLPPGLTPSKPRARAGALEWLLARLHLELQLDLRGVMPATAELALLRALKAALRELRGISRAVLGDMSPSFTPTLQAIDALAPEPLADLATTETATETTTVPEPLADPVAPPPLTASSTLTPTGDTPAPAVPALVSSPLTAVDGVLAHQQARAAAWLEPLGPTAPCGLDPAGLEAFGDAREELAKLSSVSGAVVDWARVEARSAMLLRDSAKDLRVASWFALARFHREGLSGLALGLCVLVGLLDAFGDELHPRRIKSRREIADWLIRQAATAIASFAPAKLRADPLAELGVLAERLGLALRARLADEAPSMRPLREAIREANEALSALAPPRQAQAPAAPAGEAGVGSSTLTDASKSPTAPIHPVTASADPTGPKASSEVVTSDPPPRSPQSGATSPVAPAPPTALADLADLERFMTSTGEAMQQAARTLRESVPTDPRAYRLLRVGLWIHLTAAPPLRPDGNTGLSGLADRDRAQLDELAAAARWPGLLTRAENLLVNHRLVLDLQRHSATALAALGPEYDTAGLALRAELRALLTRLPSLPALRDRDGQPLADPTTQQWISAEVAPRGAQIPALAEDRDDPKFWAGLADALRRDDRNAQLVDAQRRIDASPDGQLRCARRLALAEACATASAHALASALFAGLADDLERRDLERWDPPFAARCLAGLARSQQRNGEAPAARLAIHRLGRLDVAAAAALLAEFSPSRTQQ